MTEPAKPDPLDPGWVGLTRSAFRALSSFVLPVARPRVEALATGLPTIVSSDTLRAERVPKGQMATNRWPVLHAGATPKVDLATWTFELSGLVESSMSWTWAEFRALPAAVVKADMHCVTRWTRLDNAWEGVPVREVLRHVAIRPEARFASIEAEHGFTTNLPIEALLGEDCLFAWSHDGKPLDPDHGWPLRLVVPRLYAWKSAKWVRGIEFLAEDRPGFWEQNGYHNLGDPWLEQRYW